jgi:heme-degrading monooxygenase HmoA
MARRTIHETDGAPITLINLFEVDTEKLEAFVAGWRERAELMSKRPGFRSLRLHRALRPDALFQVVNVAQ